MSLILTLKLDDNSFETLNLLRQRHFPERRNFVPAHVTLFHQLPAMEEQVIVTDLADECARNPVLNLAFPAVRSLGRGVAVEVSCAALVDLRKRLASRWWQWLGRQDSSPYRPHVTIQNKVSPSAARLTLETLAGSWRPFQGQGTGLQLWQYMGGPWKPLTEHLFDEPDDPSHG